jgi:hypothetical protein
MPAQLGRLSRAPRSGCFPIGLFCVGSAFRHHPPNADFGPLTPQSSTVVPQHEREN